MSGVGVFVIMAAPVLLDPSSASCSNGTISGETFLQYLLTGPSAQAPYVLELNPQTSFQARVDAIYAATTNDVRQDEAQFCAVSSTDAGRNTCRLYAAFSSAYQVITYSVDGLTYERFRFQRSGQAVQNNPALRRSIEGENDYAVTRAFMTNPAQFELVCPSTLASPARVAETGQTGAAWQNIVVTGDRGDITEPFSKRSFATYGFTDRVRDDSEIWDIDAVIGYNLGSFEFLPFSSEDGWRDPYAYLSIRRRSGDLASADDELNEFSLGYVASRVVGGERRFFSGHHAYSIDARYLTDDSLDARGVGLELRYDLPFGHWDDFGAWRSFGDSGFAYTWYATSLLDGTWIDNPGDTFPSGTNDHVRIGADVEFELRYVSERLPFVTALELDYSVRDDLDSSGDADAAHFVGALSLRPGPTSSIQFSLQYETGQDLVKLSEQQQWVLKLGLRY